MGLVARQVAADQADGFLTRRDRPALTASGGKQGCVKGVCHRIDRGGGGGGCVGHCGQVAS
ncbi:hypothetical protein SXCC_03332 [Gluconacetobacter sp. SXCC-1]|nr:hypothetical protein SXCC_03332 [Gluconacetobacter sp. SXCC-1]